MIEDSLLDGEAPAARKPAPEVDAGAPREPTRVSCAPIFKDNYVWIIHDPAGQSRVAVVDPGDAAAVDRRLESDGLELGAILITHHHSDHTGGVAELASRHRVPVFGPARHAYAAAVPVQASRRLEIPRSSLEIEVMEVPGHTRDHVAFRTHDAVFCGDTLFSAGCGRLIEGTAAQMWRSLCRLARLPPDTRVYSTHEYTLANLDFAAAVEPDNIDANDYRAQCRRSVDRGRASLPSTIGRELKVNPFLRCALPEVHRAAEAHARRRLDDAGEVFSVLRAWKDAFVAPAEGTSKIL